MALALNRPISPAHAPRLVEREVPLAELYRHLAAAGEGSGRTVVVRGETGIGKTTLVASFLASLPPDVTVLAGASDSISTPRPFGPLHDMVPDLGSELATLLDAGASRHRVAAWLGDHLARSGHTVVVVEDLQWSDDATLELLAYLARRSHGTRALIVATYREDDTVSPRLRQVLGTLASLPAVHQLGLQPLTRAGVAELTSDTRLDPDELHRLTGGNPFFVSEVIAAEGASIPISVRDAIAARVERLDARARRALGAAAILGARVEPWLLAAVAGEDVLGIDDCVAAGLLSKSAGISFRHELTRLTVLEELPVFQAIGLHRRALDALTQAGGVDAARLAYHAEQAADGAAVRQHASAAGDHATATGANRVAAEQYERALRFADAADDEFRAGVLEKLSFAHFLVNEIPLALDERRRAVELRRAAGDVLREGDGLRHLAYLTWIHGNGREADRIAADAVRVLEPMGETRELAMAWSMVGALAMIADRNAEAREWSERALEVGRRLGDTEVQAHALNNIGSSLSSEGDPAGQALVLESLRMAQEANLPWHIDRALYNLAGAALENRRLQDADRFYHEVLDYMSIVQVERCSIDVQLAAVEFELGRFDEAERLATASLDAIRIDSMDRVGGYVVLSRVAALRGTPDDGTLLRAAEEQASGFDDLERVWPIAVAHAEAAWLGGSLDDVVPELERAYEMARAGNTPWAIGELGRWLWRAGRLDALDARAAAPYALQVAGDWRAAEAEWLRLDIPLEAALCRADSNDPADLRDAHARLDRLGAHAAALRVAARLRELGAAVPRGPRPATRRHPAGLTERERQIAEMAASGMTNREIAERLVLAEKTVGHHVSAVLAKLGVRRRSEIGTAIRDS